jgi:Flp pilus assembly protein TadG
MNARPLSFKPTQHGVAAVEFALVATILLVLLLGIIEFGRLFFTINSVQEITRRAAREQVVRWTSAQDAVQRMAVLRPGSSGTVNFPGAGDITNADVRLSFHNTYPEAVAGTDPITGIASPGENISNCLNEQDNCIRFVRATLSQDANGLTPLDFNVIAPYMPADTFSLPFSTVIMPAEALGLL